MHGVRLRLLQVMLILELRAAALMMLQICTGQHHVHVMEQGQVAAAQRHADVQELTNRGRRLLTVVLSFIPLQVFTPVLPVQMVEVTAINPHIKTRMSQKKMAVPVDVVAEAVAPDRRARRCWDI